MGHASPQAAARGLGADEARQRLALHGPNELPREAATPAWKVFLRQFASPMVWLLFAAAALAALLGEVVDAVAIATILLLNGVVGYLQEAKAERAILSLRSLTAPRARVIRDGHPEEIPAARVVPGDVLLLEAGDVVAADGRLLEAHGLELIEAPLTGESLPVHKSTEPVPGDTPLAERTDSVFLGTHVSRGVGRAEVVHTGAATEMGRIARLLASAESGPTSLQRRLDRVVQHLLVVCLGVVGLVAGIGLLRGQPWLDVLLASVSLAVAAVPEGLPAVVTIALALGVQRLATRNVLVRRLPAVESLGSATVICTDKTGTLTTGQMGVREHWGADEGALLEAAASCCDASPGVGGKPATGDPTEIAILAAAAALGIHRSELERTSKRLVEHPFDSDRKRMSILRDVPGIGPRLYVKGAVDSLLPLCVKGVEGAEEANREMAERGLRVLGVAIGHSAEEQDLELLGLLGLADPPRPEAIEAIAHAKAAGIHTVMITGDHPVTARAIATELGLLEPGVDWREQIHARVTAEEKLHIVREWKGRGAVVAMTGDGVNDAPALREADIGIAMGRAGTEVTREAADLVLADDNYASIVAGVLEGRGIFQNIRKTLVYLLAGNTGELLIMFVAACLAFPVPLLPVQLLWINLVTDGFPALALVMDPSDPDVLKVPPRPPDEPMLRGGEWLRVLLTGALEATLVLGVFVYHLPDGVELARTMGFTTLVFAEVLRAFAARHPWKLFWEVGLFSNLRLIGVVCLTVLVQLGLLLFPFTREVFGLVPIETSAVFECLALGLIPVTILELAKIPRRWTRRGGTSPEGTGRG